MEREKLPAGAVNETGYYTDELGWIYTPADLEEGMEAFYDETGVQPYLYLSDGVDGDPWPDTATLEGYADQLYDQLFTDEGHLLLVYLDNGQSWRAAYTTGSQARAVFDEEAASILRDYLDQYYTSDLTDEEYFSTAFQKTAERMMHITRSPWPYVLIAVAAVVVIAIAFTWWRRAKEKKAQEQKRVEEMLNTPLETFGQSEAERRAKNTRTTERMVNMGILDRFGDIIKANVNAVLDKMEDPAKMIDQYLRDMMEDLAEVKRETAGVMAEETRTRRQLEDNQKEVARYQELAKKALTAGNEGDARVFLEKKQQLEQQGAALQAAYDMARGNAEKMRQLHDKLTADISQLQTRRQAVKAKVAVARTQEKVNQYSAPATGRSRRRTPSPAWSRRPTPCSTGPTPWPS